MNRVQFKSDLSMPDFMHRYGSEAQCEAALMNSRWPQGFACPHVSLPFAHHLRVSWAYHLQCRRCRYETTATAGTIFFSTKLPLTVWFLAKHRLTQAKNNVSAHELMRSMGVDYSVAWRIKHKVLHTMAQRASRRQPFGRVEIDDAVLRGSPQASAGAVHPTTCRSLSVCRPSATTERIKSRFAVRRSPKTQSVNGQRPLAFDELAREVAELSSVITGSGRAAAEYAEFRCVNIVLDNLKTLSPAPTHAFNFAKHALRYPAALTDRFSRV